MDNKITIMYVSDSVHSGNEAGVPAELSLIYQEARRSNPLVNISGLLTFNRGRYLQILEGPIRDVYRLFEKIKKDSRHKNIRTLVNQKTEQQVFSAWGMKLVSSLDDVEEFQQYLSENLISIGGLVAEKRRLLESFFTLSSNPATKDHAYSGRRVSISRWPDYSKIDVSLPVMELSAKLLAGQSRYDELLSSPDFGTRNQVKELVSHFDDMGILVVSEYEKSQVEKSKSSLKQSSFYSRMSRFLKGA